VSLDSDAINKTEVTQFGVRLVWRNDVVTGFSITPELQQANDLSRSGLCHKILKYTQCCMGTCTGSNNDLLVM